MKCLALSVMIGLSLLLCAQLHAKSDATVTHSPSIQDTSLVLGNTQVILRLIQRGQGKKFIHLHENETTALHAAQSVIQEEGGQVLTLVHSGQRNVTFFIKGVRYSFDPNRIFTDAGIKKTLQAQGAYSPQAHQEVEQLSRAIKAHLTTGKIIAVHNNRHYSLKNYFPGQELEHEARALHVEPLQSTRNFYLATQPNDYHRLKKMRFNSLLQIETPEDDGSLSVYLANRQYINVEAGYDALHIQIDMLRYA